MMRGIKRHLRLGVDWTVGRVFGRDSSELGQLGHPPVPEAGETRVRDAAAVRN